MVGRRVFVYRNLSSCTRSKGRYSIQSREGKDYGLVIGHADEITLRDCEFKVSEAGRKRVLRDRRKNVHAGILGYIAKGEVNGVQVFYDPYTAGHFLTKRGRKVSKAGKVSLSERGVFIDG
jgi:hypothetical protein